MLGIIGKKRDVLDEKLNHYFLIVVKYCIITHQGSPMDSVSCRAMSFSGIYLLKLIKPMSFYYRNK